VSGRAVSAGAEEIGSIKTLGQVLYTDFILPFEVASVLFLVAMIGAVVLAKREKKALTIGHEHHSSSASSPQS
jgi:NADH-quinone oxidoreductase subunit J